MSFGGLGVSLALVTWLVLAAAVVAAQRRERRRAAVVEAEYEDLRAQMRSLEPSHAGWLADELDPRGVDRWDRTPRAALDEQLRAALRALERDHC